MCVFVLCLFFFSPFFFGVLGVFVCVGGVWWTWFWGLSSFLVFAKKNFPLRVFLAFWFDRTAGKNFEEEVVVLQFCFNSRGEILVADSSFFFSPERDSIHLFFRDALQRWSFWWWAPTNKCLSSARREGKPIAGESPPARPPLQWITGRRERRDIHTSMFRNHVLGFRIHHCSKNSQLPK